MFIHQVSLTYLGMREENCEIYLKIDNLKWFLFLFTE